MNAIKAFGAICALALGTATAAMAMEAYYVVTTTDFLGNKFFTVADKQKLAEMKLEFKKQNALLPKVLKEIQDDFRKNPDAHSGEKYYGGKLKPKQIKESAPLPAYDKAQEKADKMQEKEDNKDLEKDNPKGKKKKQPTEAEKEKAYEEQQKQFAIASFAEDVEKMIKDKLKEEESK